MTRSYLIAAVLGAASAVLAAWAWLALPPGAGVPIHVLGADGQRHLAVSRGIVWLMPFIALAVLAVMARVGFKGAAPGAAAWDATVIGVPGVLLVAQATLIGRALDPTFDVMGPVALAVAVLLLGLGNVLGKARHNAVFGVRTPWTLADPRVWDKTHRFVGRGWVLSGLVLAVLAFVVRSEPGLGLAIAACTAIPPLVGVAWSRRLAHHA